AMPADVAARINREVNAALKAPDVIERLTRAGAEPVGGTPEAFKAIIRSEYENWKALIARAGIKPESGA
ncbi:MAG: tripartite tricarboxylate transporter substrate binding protein, partial [Betaproteobacteria bacterium]|nr:tripartite tricarboxylate transporter substrate binding protein [Betaproteobacteria bacterium]